MKHIPSKFVPLMATALVLLLMVAFGSIRYSHQHFFSLGNLVAQLNGNAVLGVAAIGGTFVILSGGIDLSVGSMIACATIATTVMIGNPTSKDVHELHLNPALVWTLVLLGGALIGASMGTVIHLSKLPPFLVTLAFMFVARGLGYTFFIQQKPLNHPWYDFIHDHLKINLERGVNLYFYSTCFLVAVVIAAIILHLTKFGRSVYALGDDEHSASLMGLNTARTKILVYTIAGFCSAAAGLLETINSSAGDPAGQMGRELDVIAAVVIGGTLLTGGVGYVIGTVMGVLILGTIQNLVDFEGINNTAISPIVKGVLLLLFILLQKGVAELSRRSAKSAALKATLTHAARPNA